MANVKGEVKQLNTAALDATLDYLQLSEIGQLWTADWKYKLILAGRAYRMSFGTISGGTDITLGGDATGGIDLDQPEGVVAVDTDVLIPMELEISGDADLDAAGDDVQVLLTADRATAVASGATATTEVPDNLLDGGATFGGRAYSLVTGDITDPVHSDVLYFRKVTSIVAEGTASNMNPTQTDLYFYRDFVYPTFLAGPCSLLLYAAGEVAFTFAGSITFAHVPRAWCPIT